MTIRDGKVVKLQLGEVSMFDIKRPWVVSTKQGAEVVAPRNGFTKRRAQVETFILSKKFSVPMNELYAKRSLVFKRMYKEFAQYEVNEVLRRINNADDLVYAPVKEVESLKKLFKGLGKQVAVLPSGKVIDLGKDFTLVVRTDMDVVTSVDNVRLMVDIVIWEDVGFMHKL